MEELIRSLATFGGTRTEDVRKWLQDLENVFDQVQLRPSNKFIVAQSYLTTTAATWFRFNKSNILDWPTFQLEITKAFGLSTLSKISSTLTIPPKEQENENNQVDLINVNQTKSCKDLEDKSPREHEQSYCSPISLIIHDPGLKIQPQGVEVNEYDELTQQGVHVVNNCDQLEQQDESVIKSGSVKPDCENVLETVAESVGGLTAAHSDINTVVPTDAQCLWSDKRRTRKSCIFKKIYTGYNWNHNELPDEDNAFNTITKEWNYLVKDALRCYFQNGLYKLRFHFRKWRYRK
jgi:hypothetical protein